MLMNMEDCPRLLSAPLGVCLMQPHRTASADSAMIHTSLVCTTCYTVLLSIQANTYDSSFVFQINSDYLDGLLNDLDKSFEFDLLCCAGAGLSRIFRDPTTN